LSSFGKLDWSTFFRDVDWLVSGDEAARRFAALLIREALASERHGDVARY
jgi:hypothetical protein